MRLNRMGSAVVSACAGSVLTLALLHTSVVNAQQGQPPPSTAPRPGNPMPRPVPPQLNPSQPLNPSSQPLSPASQGRYQRPFAFQSPEFESRFMDSSRRLMTMEGRMDTANQALTQRLGEIRNLPADRQNAAMTDLFGQMLRNQAEMQRYLVQARTAWSGDIDPIAEQQAPVDPNSVNPRR